MTKREIIDETAGFYTSENRAQTTSGDCSYLLPDGRKCAVGRTLTEKALGELREVEMLNNSVDDLTVYGENDEALWDMQQEQYRGHSTDFWADLQDLHDTKDNWTSEGLSVQGKDRVNKLIAKHT